MNRITKKNRWLLALDLDGTIVDESEQITDNTRYYLKRVLDENNEICIATGRFFDSARQLAVKYNLWAPLITCNGALIKDPFTLEEYYKLEIDGQEARKISEYTIKIDALLHVFMDAGWFVNKITDRVLEFGKKYQVTPRLVDEIQRWDKLGIVKMVVVDQPEKMNKLEDWARKNCSKIGLIRSDPYSMDIIHKKASKGNALKKLAEMMGFERDRIIAVGNYYNDIEMFKVAKIGVAMGDSPAEVKEAADYVTFSVKEEGVVDVIRRFIITGSGNYSSVDRKKE